MTVSKSVGTLIDSQRSYVICIGRWLEGAARHDLHAVPFVTCLLLKAEAVLHEVRDILIGLGNDLDITVKLIDVSVTSVVDEEREGDIGVINKDCLEGVDSEETVIVAFTHGGNGEE